MACKQLSYDIDEKKKRADKTAAARGPVNIKKPRISPPTTHKVAIATPPVVARA
jgi:hypothetical protein